MNEQFKRIPSIDSILNKKFCQNYNNTYGNKITLHAVKKAVEKLRNSIKNGKAIENIEKEIEKISSKIIKELTDYSLKKILNGTGVIIHTNLGRAVVSKEVMEHVTEISTNFSNLEYDLKKGKRGHRDSHAEKLISLYFNVESACIVNNNAAAVLLMLNTFADKKEVVVSRGELVEIGGSFRIPEVMKKAGCKLVEVGSTNRTHLSDYENAINKKTGMVLKVHPSNYRIEGFTKSVEVKELSHLCDENNVIFAEDMGSGNIYDLQQFNINDEPKVSESLKSGIKLVSFSGDKLLGTVQCGFIIGRKKLVEKVKKNHLLRALRVDKMVYSAVEKHFSLLLSENFKEIPVHSMLFNSPETIKHKVDLFFKNLSENVKTNLTKEKLSSKIGGGTTPEKEIDSFGFSIKHPKLSAEKIAKFFRNCQVPLIGRIENDKFIIDMRTILNKDLKVLEENVTSIFKM